VASAQATAADAHSQLRRARMLGDLVSAEEREALEAKAETASASLEAARVAVNVARLNLERTLVRATVNGYVANLLLKPGDYLAAGAQGLAVVDADTMWIDGYFEETKLPRIHVGDRARVLLMGETSPIEGRVESIAPGIDDRERTNASNQLASVNPTFNWVRLAQRVPVRIALVRVPQDIRLIAGRTATVDVIDGAGRTVHAGGRS
jgi:multidrug resistance efflux pump